MPARALARVAAAAAVTVFAALLAGPPAQAAPPAGSPLTVTLELAPSAGAAGRARISSYAAAHGLTVVGATARSVSLRGPADLAAAAFGTTPRTKAAQRHGVARPYVTASTAPRVPAALRGVVDAAVGLSNRPLLRPLTVGTQPLDGYDLHQLYGPTTTAANGAGLTIGVLAFSGWHRSDLDAYAAAAGIPLAPGQVTDVSINGADPGQVDGMGGEFEVALDVETLLAVAPRASIRVYVARNDLPNAVAAFERMGDDAASGAIQVAVSSWGACEQVWEQEQAGVLGSNGALTKAVNRIVTQGATLFAASGDAGADDCVDSGLAPQGPSVDFPASDPVVVGVGGTSLRPSSTPSEVSWSGSGGGRSRYYTAGSWQRSVTGASAREVPDVAAIADRDNPGVAVYSDGAWQRAGGTSVSAPVVAGMLTSAMSAAGRRTGFGNILPTIYGHPSDLDDITTGSGNGTYTPGVGFDMVTGLGAPRFDRLVTDLQLAPTNPADGALTRMAGPDRIATSVAVSQQSFPTDGSATSVVLARSDGYADALAGTPLAVHTGGPMLLTPTGSLDSRVAAELQRVLPMGQTVYLLGNDDAISADVQHAVENLGYPTRRLGGVNRFATATQIADLIEATGGSSTVLLTTGLGFADALSAGTAAASLDGVLLLTDGTSPASATTAWLHQHGDATVFAVGGAAATADPDASRLVGRDRYETAVIVSHRFLLTTPTVGLATGLNFPDALSAGAQLGAEHAPLLLTAPGALPGLVANELGRRRHDVTGLSLYGDTHAVSAVTQREATQSLGWTWGPGDPAK